MCCQIFKICAQFDLFIWFNKFTRIDNRIERLWSLSREKSAWIFTNTHVYFHSDNSITLFRIVRMWLYRHIFSQAYTEYGLYDGITCNRIVACICKSYTERSRCSNIQIASFTDDSRSRWDCFPTWKSTRFRLDPRLWVSSTEFLFFPHRFKFTICYWFWITREGSTVIWLTYNHRMVFGTTKAKPYTHPHTHTNRQRCYWLSLMPCVCACFFVWWIVCHLMIKHLAWFHMHRIA